MKKLTPALFALLLTLQATPLLAAPATSPLQQAGEGDVGPTTIVGDVKYVSDEITIVGQEPVAALIDVSSLILGDSTAFVPYEGQILGRLTSPLAPAPATYTVQLPITPTGSAVDVDNDGEEDTGVQIFASILAANLNGGSWLEQLDQASDLQSVLRDPATGTVLKGSLLIYAADDGQGFPTGAGEDGLFFTADDPTGPVARGYTVANLAADGTVTLDRSSEARMDVLQRQDAAWPNFSSMGILESYNALIDTLAREYAFTELRGLDWEEIRTTYLPEVEAAEAAADLVAYDVALRTMAQFVRDAHVMTNGPGQALFETPIAANLGANAVELSDGAIVVGVVAPGSALDQAGVVVGSEIVTIDAVPVEERIPTVLYSDATGTEEGQRLRQVRNLLRFPAGAEVELGYRLPESSELLTATLAAAAYPLGDPLSTPRGKEEISYDVLDDVFGYVTWKDFTDPVPTVDTYKDFLRLLNERVLTPSLIAAPGIILDMRSNGGGWDVQYKTMGSFLFDAENPIANHWNENARFNAETGEWERSFVPDWQLSAPDAEAYYPGEVVVLIDPSCASSCEFFTSFLQSAGRVTVIGEYASNGAGGPIKRATMPGGFIFQYPWQGVLFAGTDELVLEATGVQPDVRVPITVDALIAKSEGGDPVLETALQVLKEQAAANLATDTTLIPFTDPQGMFSGVAPDGWLAQGRTFINLSNSEILNYVVGRPPLTLAPIELASQLIIRPPSEVELIDERTVDGRTWSIFSAPLVQSGAPFVRHVAITTDDTGTYAIGATVIDFNAEVMLESVLYPAIDNFAPIVSE